MEIYMTSFKLHVEIIRNAFNLYLDLLALVDTCARKLLKKIKLTVKIDIVEEPYYLKQVFHLLFY